MLVAKICRVGQASSSVIVTAKVIRDGILRSIRIPSRGKFMARLWRIVLSLESEWARIDTGIFGQGRETKVAAIHTGRWIMSRTYRSSLTMEFDKSASTLPLYAFRARIRAVAGQRGLYTLVTRLLGGRRPCGTCKTLSSSVANGKRLLICMAFVNVP